MTRLPFVLLTALAVVLGYILARPAALHHDVASRAVASSVLHVQAGAPMHARTATSTAVHHTMRAALTGNPPRGLTRRLRVSLPVLHLPRTLPATELRVPILMYHHVSSQPPATEMNYGLTVTDADFAAQLNYLHRHGYHTILLRRLFAALYQHKPLPAHAIVLTFDDGYLDNYTDALPILRHYHDVGEFNIISAYAGITLGVNRYMTWAQLKVLVSDGMEIGSHTVDHQDLGLLPVDKVRFELRDSRNILQQRLGVPVQFLAYPSGEPFAHGSAYAQQLLLSLMPQYGYVGAVLDGPLTTSRQDARAPYQLQRIRVSGGEGIGDYAGSLQS